MDIDKILIVAVALFTSHMICNFITAKAAAKKRIAEQQKTLAESSHTNSDTKI